MAATDTRGFLSLKALLFLGALVVAGLYFAGPLREWGEAQFHASDARTREFDRRVKAKRLAPIKHELAQAGIHIEEAPAATSTEEEPAAEVTRPTIWQQVKGLWAKLTGAAEAVNPPPPPIPVMRDSLGLLPGERMVLPGGRIVEYDTGAVMKVWREKQ